MYEKYFDALGAVFVEFVNWLEHNQQRSDNSVAHALCNRWGYLFPELSYFDWLDMLAEYRRKQKSGDFPNEYKGG